MRFFFGAHVALSLGALAANYYLHHPHRINVMLGYEPLISAPSIENDPPQVCMILNSKLYGDDRIANLNRQNAEIVHKDDSKVEIILPNRKYTLTSREQGFMYTQEKEGKMLVRKIYDGKGRRRILDYMDSKGKGMFEVYDTDGNRFTNEIQNGKLQGLTVYRDKYGDYMYYGKSTDGLIHNRWSIYSECAGIFGVLCTNFLFGRRLKAMAPIIKNKVAQRPAFERVLKPFASFENPRVWWTYSLISQPLRRSMSTTKKIVRNVNN